MAPRTVSLVLVYILFQGAMLSFSAPSSGSSRFAFEDWLAMAVITKTAALKAVTSIDCSKLPDNSYPIDYPDDQCKNEFVVCLKGSLFKTMCNPSTLVYDASVGMCVNLTDAKSDACRKWPDLISSGTCTGTGGEPGMCIPSCACNLLGKTTSGTCGLEEGINSCCINVVKECDQTITENNTYWRSPTNLSSVTSCSLTVKLSDSVITNKKRPICQVRLDFIGFTTAQPNFESECTTDSFTVSIAGNTHTPSPICGDNDGQHMYLHVPSSAIQETDVKLSFSLNSAETVTKSWNIKIALLPCGASYLAPENCLQYFTSDSGQITSFNWKDKALLDPTMTAPTRQLANQNHLSCIRSQSASVSQICYTACSESSFIISTNSADGDAVLNRNQQSLGDCNNDFLIIPGGFNPTHPFNGIDQPNFADRYCGERLSSDPPVTKYLPDAGTTNQMVCSTFLPFHIFYGTNGDETMSPIADIAGRGNQGFCVNFFQE